MIETSLGQRLRELRIERFVEKQFKTALIYEDLGPENLGCTIFNSSGALVIRNTRFEKQVQFIRTR